MSDTITLLGKMMDATSARHQVLAQNLANVNTPGFHRQDILFKDSLQQAMQSPQGDALRAFQPEVTDDTTSPMRPDGNNVSTQTELGQISQNELLYRLSTRLMSMKLMGLKKAMQSN